VILGHFEQLNKCWARMSETRPALFCLRADRNKGEVIFWMDRIVPPLRELPASQVMSVIDQTQGVGTLRVRVATQDIAGDDVTKGIRLNFGGTGDARKRLAESGIVLSAGERSTITSVRLGPEAARQRLRPGDTIEWVLVPNERPSPFLFAIPAVAALFGLALLQRRRRTISLARR
jgi:hypothetical protein